MDVSQMIRVLMLAFAALSTFGVWDSVGAAEFRGIGTLPGSRQTEVTGISADGSAIVGYTISDKGVSPRAYLWTESRGIEYLGSLSPHRFSAATSISADGKVIVGGSAEVDTPTNHSEAFRWTRDGGMAALGELPGGEIDSSATGVSADGSVVVGVSSVKGGYEAFRWTASAGIEGLGWPQWSNVSAAYGVSGDGQTILAQDNHNHLVGGNAYWSFLLRGSEPFQRIENPNGVRANFGKAISGDGKVVVGSSTRIVDDKVLETPFRWTQETGLVELGDPAGSTCCSRALDVSADGARIVGSTSIAGKGRSFLWDKSHGFRDVQTLLEADAATKTAVQGWRLEAAYTISDDGRVVAGAGIDPKGHRSVWRAVLDVETR